MPVFTVQDLDATERVARRLTPMLADGDVIELVGPIGAGKTTFTGALARALGAREPVRSPTYTVAHAYELAGGRVLAHLDCYRDQGELDAHAWGDLEPYFERGIACVEWPAPIRRWIADRRRWRVVFDIVDLERRVLRVDAPAGVDGLQLVQPIGREAVPS
jgi:tRNA threonylcarbamoyladenosine biosynthesis protein TsaE